MRDQKWSDERINEALKKSGRLTGTLSRKSRKKIENALLDENARLSDQKKPQESERGRARFLASLFHH